MDGEADLRVIGKSLRPTSAAAAADHPAAGLTWLRCLQNVVQRRSDARAPLNDANKNLRPHDRYTAYIIYGE